MVPFVSRIGRQAENMAVNEAYDVVGISTVNQR